MKTIQNWFGALGVFLSSLAFAGNQTDFQVKLEEQLRSDNLMEHTIPEKYNPEKQEIVIWSVHTAGNPKYGIKSEIKRTFEEEKRDGRTPLFDFKSKRITKGKVDEILRVFGLEDTKPIEVYKKTLGAEIVPEGYKVTCNVEVPRPGNIIRLQPHYLSEVDVNPVRYDSKKKELVVEIPQIGSGYKTPQKFELAEERLGDRISDISVVNYEKRERHLIERVEDYDIQKNGNLELRIISERVVPESEPEDAKKSEKYNLISIKEKNLKLGDFKIDSIKHKFIGKERKEVIEVNLDKVQAIRFKLDSFDYRGYSELPDYLIIDSTGREFYARTNRKTGELEVYDSKEGEVEFSDYLHKILPKLRLDVEEKKPKNKYELSV